MNSPVMPLAPGGSQALIPKPRLLNRYARRSSFKALSRCRSLFSMFGSKRSKYPFCFAKWSSASSSLEYSGWAGYSPLHRSGLISFLATGPKRRAPPLFTISVTCASQPSRGVILPASDIGQVTGVCAMRRKRTNLAPEPALHPFIEKMIERQNLAEIEASKYANLADPIELMILVLWVIKSRDLWALAADALPKQFGWQGAGISGH